MARIEPMTGIVSELDWHEQEPQQLRCVRSLPKRRELPDEDIRAQAAEHLRSRQSVIEAEEYDRQHRMVWVACAGVVGAYVLAVEVAQLVFPMLGA